MCLCTAELKLSGMQQPQVLSNFCFLMNRLYIILLKAKQHVTLDMVA